MTFKIFRPCKSSLWILTEQNGLEGVIEPKVEPTVDEDADAADNKAPVEASDTVAAKGLDVNIHNSIELTLARSDTPKGNRNAIHYFSNVQSFGTQLLIDTGEKSHTSAPSQCLYSWGVTSKHKDVHYVLITAVGQNQIQCPLQKVLGHLFVFFTKCTY